MEKLNLKFNYILEKENHKMVFKPIDKFFQGIIDDNMNKFINWLKERNKDVSAIYCVGDVVSNHFYNNFELRNIIQLLIIDNKTHGKSYHDHNFKSDLNRILVKNPYKFGFSGQSAKIIKDLIEKNDKALIIVDGYEDLLVTPLLYFAPINSIIVYGQVAMKLDNIVVADEGLVVIEVTKERKNELKGVLKYFKKEIIDN